MRKNRHKYDGKIGNKIGETSENILKTALQELKKANDISSFEKKDLPGIDFFMITHSGDTIYLDAKSGYYAAYLHSLKYKESYAVVVPHKGRKLKLEELRRLIKKVKNDLKKILKYYKCKLCVYKTPNSSPNILRASS